MKFGIILTAILLMLSCAAPARVSPPRPFVLPFVLTRGTPVSVLVHNDFNGVKGRVEKKLTRLGINIVPVDAVRKAVDKNRAVVIKGGPYPSRSAIGAGKDQPAALIISVEYQVYNAANIQEVTIFFNARFIDFATQKVLAQASFWHEDNLVTLDYTLDNFAQEIATHIK